jgi:hypothetical protein
MKKERELTKRISFVIPKTKTPIKKDKRLGRRAKPKNKGAKNGW